MNHSIEKPRRYGRFTPYEDEKIIRVQHMHWRNRVGPAVTFTVCFILLLEKVKYPQFSFIGFIINRPLGKTVHELLFFLTTSILITLILKSAASYTRNAFVRYYVTDQRIVSISGVMSMHSSEILLLRCENIHLDQRLWERIFNSGDIELYGAGTGLVLNDVYKARELKHLISELVHQQMKHKVQLEKIITNGNDKEE